MRSGRTFYFYYFKMSITVIIPYETNEDRKNGKKAYFKGDSSLDSLSSRL